MEILRRSEDIPNVTIYGDFSGKERCAIVALNIGDYDSSEVSNAPLLTEYQNFYQTRRTLRPPNA